MPFKRILAALCTLVLSTSIEAMAAQVKAHSAGQPVMLVDSTGAVWRASSEGLKVSLSATQESMLIARFVNEGIQIESADGRVFRPIEGRSTGFYGTRNDPQTVLKLIRHYDGKISLMSQDGKVLFVDGDGTIRREKMAKIGKNAIFTLSTVKPDGTPATTDAFDCSPARMKEIRKRYVKVANNKKLKSQVVSSEAEHEYFAKTRHRFYKGALAVEHITSGHSGGEWDRYTYFWQSDRAYFEYDVGMSHAEGIKTEVRRYSSGSGGLCRCLFREIKVDWGETGGPQFQQACTSESVKRNPARAWE